MSLEAKMEMYEGIVEPSLLYESEVWGLNAHERNGLEAVEMYTIECVINL